LGFKYELVVTQKWLTFYWATLYVSLQYFYDVPIRHLKKKNMSPQRFFFRTTHRLCTVFQHCRTSNAEVIHTCGGRTRNTLPYVTLHIFMGYIISPLVPSPQVSRNPAAAKGSMG